jgi:hypothetical protein
MFKNKRILGLVVASVLMVLSLGLYIYSLGASSSQHDPAQDEQLLAQTPAEPEKPSGKEASKVPEKDSLQEAHAERDQAPAARASSAPMAMTEKEHSSNDKLAESDSPAKSHGNKGAENLESDKAAKREAVGDKEQVNKHQEEVAEVDKKSEEFGTKYRPRIIGRCKVLYTQFNLQKLEPSQFHAFAYSFDGKSGYCADSGGQASLKLAQEVALKDCEKNKQNVDGYAPCFIYSNN